MFAWWLVVGGGGTGPALHKVQLTQTLGFRSNLTPPLSLPLPSTLGAQECWLDFFFSLPLSLQEMKRSSVQRSSEGLVPHQPTPPTPLRDGGERRGRSRTSSRPAFEVWEVKITGTALRLNRRFHLPGQIKALAAGARLPSSPLTSKPADPPPPQLPLALPFLSPCAQLWGFFWCH